MKRELNLKMAQEVKGQNAQLNINEDTRYIITYDIFSKDREKYLYIKMDEITCDAPFYYNCSYTIDELHSLHSIFKVFEKQDFEEFIPYVKELFDKGKILLKFKDEKEEVILMEINAILFSKSIKITLELYREMISYLKDQKLIDLYSINKKNLKILKEMKLYLEENEADEKDQKVIDDILNLYNSYEIPGIEKENKINKKKKPKKKKSYICGNLCKLYKFNCAKGFNIALNIINNSDIDWHENKIKLVYDTEKSNLNYSKIDYPNYDIAKGQEGDFLIVFDRKDLKVGNKYLCNLQIFVDKVKLENSDIPLNIQIINNKK